MQQEPLKITSVDQGLKVGDFVQLDSRFLFREPWYRRLWRRLLRKAAWVRVASVTATTITLEPPIQDVGLHWPARNEGPFIVKDQGADDRGPPPPPPVRRA